MIPINYLVFDPGETFQPSLIFGQKDFGAKAAHKMLVKLTPEVNVIKKSVCRRQRGKIGCVFVNAKP